MWESLMANWCCFEEKIEYMIIIYIILVNEWEWSKNNEMGRMWNGLQLMVEGLV